MSCTICPGIDTLWLGLASVGKPVSQCFIFFFLHNSLREAQAVLMKRSLSHRGSRDKMATLLRKHVEKERKKLLSVTPSPPPNSSPSSASSSSVKTHVRTFHTQKGQYTVHFTAPTGQLMQLQHAVWGLMTFENKVYRFNHFTRLLICMHLKSTFSPSAHTSRCHCQSVGPLYSPSQGVGSQSPDCV